MNKEFTLTLYCQGQAELFSLLTCLSCWYVATGTKQVDVYDDLIAGNHSISCTGQPFSQPLSSWSTLTPSQVKEWSLYHIVSQPLNDFSSITSSLKVLYGLQNGAHTTQKESVLIRIKQHKSDSKKTMGCYSTGLITDPFTPDLDILLLATNGVVLLEDVAPNLICSTEIGQQQMNNFIEERININSVGFWELISNNIQMCSNVNEKIGVKSSTRLIISLL